VLILIVFTKFRRGLPALMLAGAMATALSGAPAAASVRPSAQQDQAARTWYQQVIRRVQPLGTSLVSGLQAASEWQSGQESGTAAGQTIASDVTALRGTLRNLNRQQPLKGHPGALVAYRASVSLYLQAFLLEAAATQLAPGPLVSQLERSFTRVRQLGDVTFDVGTTELAPLLGSALSGPDVRAAHTLPNWSVEDLAPGQPLESSWVGTAGLPLSGASPKSWAAAVRDDGAPTQSAVHVAVGLHGAGTQQLAALAQTLQRAELRLNSVTGPKGDAEAPAVQQLGLLVDTEAALATEASRLTGTVPDRALGGVGSSLAAIGGALRTSPA
jgi:hypothetical protein